MSVTSRAMNSTLVSIGVAAVLLLWGGSARAEAAVDAALRKAAEQGDIATIQSLLARGADADRSDALLAAVLAGQRPSIDFLLGRGADPNAWARGRVRLPRGAQGSPVFAAAKRGDRLLIKDLKLHGANLNAASSEPGMKGETPLLYAVRHRESSAARLLIEAGADPDARDSQGVSARDVARESGAPILASINARAPAGAYSRPEDISRIIMMLSYKAACDQSTPGYALRMSANFAKWAAPRAAAIERIEADPEFQRQKAEMVRQASKLTVTTGDPQQDDDRREQAANFRALCETHLPNEFLGVVTEYTNAPGPSLSPAESRATASLLSQGASAKSAPVTVVHKSATHSTGGMSAAPVPAPNPTPP